MLATNHVSVKSNRTDVLSQHTAHMRQNQPLLAGVGVSARLQATAVAVPNARPAQTRFLSVARKSVRFN